MAALLTDINKHACKFAVHQQRHLSVILKSMASDSPELSYLPRAAAEQILTGWQQSCICSRSACCVEIRTSPFLGILHSSRNYAECECFGDGAAN